MAKGASLLQVSSQNLRILFWGLGCRFEVLLFSILVWGTHVLGDLEKEMSMCTETGKGNTLSGVSQQTLNRVVDGLS